MPFPDGVNFQEMLMLDSYRNTRALVLFFFLAFVLHIAAGLLCRAVPILYLQILVPWTPNISAILVIVFFQRQKGGVRILFSGWKKWRVSLKWYLLALSPFFIYFLSAGIYLIFGGKAPGPDPIPPLGFSFPVLAAIALITGATGEELGWRGFALPHLQKQHNALVSSLILGVYWGIWHISSWILSDSPFTLESTLLFTTTTTLNTILITCIYNNTNGSVFLASLHHWSENVWSQFVVSYLGLISWETLSWIKMPFMAILAISLIIIYGPERLSKRSTATPPDLVVG